jgi:hypothetical protein
MSVCDELIRAVAPLDFELYAYAQVARPVA